MNLARGPRWTDERDAVPCFSTCTLHSLTPEIHHAADVEEGEDDGEKDLQTRDQAGEHEEGRDEDARERQKDVPVELLHYDLQGKTGRKRNTVGRNVEKHFKLMPIGHVINTSPSQPR